MMSQLQLWDYVFPSAAEDCGKSQLLANLLLFPFSLYALELNFVFPFSGDTGVTHHLLPVGTNGRGGIRITPPFFACCDQNYV